MFPKSSLFLTAVAFFAVTEPVLGRERWLERDGRHVAGRFTRRRFGQENPAVIQKLSAACPGQFCGTIAGAAITPLLAGQPECSQQDMADDIIDLSKQFDAATQANMLAIAIEYRQAEKNTPPDFSTNPPTARNSVFCQKAPRNPELNGLVQAQDPANDPEPFFDPARGATVTVRLGEQANTAPFGGANNNTPPPAPEEEDEEEEEEPPVDTPAPAETCPPAVTVTVTAGGAEPTAPPAPPADNGGNDGGAAGGEDFGSCSVPEIEFAAGFDGRRETTFRPVDPTSFTQGSAQNVDIITRAMCDQLTNTCGANDAAKATCVTATEASKAAAKNTGAQADAFNAVFGITTNFVDVTAIDNQGNAIPGTGNGQSLVGTEDFGSCSTPEIEFAAAFDGRRETSFRPVDRTSFNHGSAQNIDIITRAMCDQLTNTCRANAAAKATCVQATEASKAATKNTGAQADAFNAVFGKTTNFAAVATVDNQGRVVSRRRAMLRRARA